MRTTKIARRTIFTYFVHIVRSCLLLLLLLLCFFI